MSFGLTQQVLWYRCWGLINSPLVAVSLACVHVLVGSTVKAKGFHVAIENFCVSTEFPRVVS